MKMNYLRDNSYNFREKKADWKKPAIFVALALFLYLFGTATFGLYFTFISYPVLRLTGEIREGWSQAMKGHKALVAENQRLSEENQKLKLEAARLGILEAENLQLRGFKDTSEVDGFLRARVLVKPSHLPYDELILDIGSDAAPNLKIGNLVFAQKDLILGRVELVNDKYSKVKLYSSADVSLPVSIGEMASPAVAQGAGAGNFSLTVPRGLDIKVGDPIKTTIIGDYLLGQAGVVKKDENDPFQKILFRSPFNIFEMEWVLIRE